MKTAGEKKASVLASRSRSSEASLRAQLIEVSQHLARHGLNQGTSGNVSVRWEDGFLITPSATPSAALRSDIIQKMRLDSEQRSAQCGARASSEWRLHRDILRARPDVNAVVHCHSVHATALAILRRPLPAAHYMIAAFGGGDVRCAPYAPFGTQELSDVAVAALAGRTAVLLAAHGAVTVGTDLAQALDRAHELETLCQTYLLALSAGTPVMLSSAEISDAVSRFADYKAASPSAAASE